MDYLVNAYWAHPLAISAAVIAVVIILVWMTGSGSRQRFIVLKRTKESDQLSRDLGRIANALEKIAKQREIPTDYVGRPIPSGWDETISAGEPSETDSAEPVAAGNVAPTKHDAVNATEARPAAAPPAVGRANPSGFTNPLGGTAGLLGGKKKLDLPNPLYRPKP